MSAESQTPGKEFYSVAVSKHSRTTYRRENGRFISRQNADVIEDKASQIIEGAKRRELAARIADVYESVEGMTKTHEIKAALANAGIDTFSVTNTELYAALDDARRKRDYDIDKAVAHADMIAQKSEYAALPIADQLKMMADSNGGTLTIGANGDVKLFDGSAHYVTRAELRELYGETYDTRSEDQAHEALLMNGSSMPNVISLSPNRPGRVRRVLGKVAAIVTLAGLGATFTGHAPDARADNAAVKGSVAAANPLTNAGVPTEKTGVAPHHTEQIKHREVQKVEDTLYYFAYDPSKSHRHDMGPAYKGTLDQASLTGELLHRARLDPTLLATLTAGCSVIENRVKVADVNACAADFAEHADRAAAAYDKLVVLMTHPDTKVTTTTITGPYASLWAVTQGHGATERPDLAYSAAVDHGGTGMIIVNKTLGINAEYRLDCGFQWMLDKSTAKAARKSTLPKLTTTQVMQPAHKSSVKVVVTAKTPENPWGGTIVVTKPTPGTPHDGGGEQPGTPLTQKSADKADYQRPGTDAANDSGVGEKPPVTAEEHASPAPVVTTTEKSSPTDGRPVIIETATKPVGSETGVQATGTSTESQQTSGTVTNVGGGTNSGTVTGP
ncbi:MAG: hypothetical protein WBB39_05150 [Candidatus Saccharimonadales bacterium]